MEHDQPNFYLLAEKHELDAATQIELLLGFIQDYCPETFDGWLSCIATELTVPHWEAAVNADMSKVKEAEMPVEHTSDLDAFFDRDLTLRNMESLVELDPDLDEYDGNTFWPDSEYYNVLEDVLRDGLRMDEEAHNAILGGYYVVFPEDDGVIVLIMVVNGDTAGKPYVDAVMVLPKDSKYRDVPNVSLPPRYQLSGVYTFDHPDGTTRTVRLAVNT